MPTLTCLGAACTVTGSKHLLEGARIESADSVSAQADADAIMRWLEGFAQPAATDALKGRIERELGWMVKAPEQGERMELGG